MNNLKEAHNLARLEEGKILQEIESIIADFDLVEILSHISLRYHFVQEEEPESNQNLREKPFVHFLVGLCLKNKNSSERQPNNQEINKIIELLDNYFKYFIQNLISEGVQKEQIAEVDNLILYARIQKLIKQINSSYQFYLEDFLVNVFCQFDDYFSENVGFTISDALDFERKIIKRFEKKLNERLNIAGEAKGKGKAFPMFTFTQEISTFNIDEFCEKENITERDKFEKYLKALSCKFGEGTMDFNSPLDENIITLKPIINIENDKYFSPIPQYLISNLPSIFENFLETEKQNKTKIWEKYNKAKASHVEGKVYEYFSRLFPKKNIYKNLNYSYGKKEFEVDTLLLYDNKIFIIESKSGSLTEPAKRGAILSLKKDLKKLIEEGYQQGKRVRDYIKSTKPAIFHNREGNKIEIDFDPHQNEFFLINVTLEDLLSFATNLKNLKSLDLFAENEYPWSVNLFELDLITRHIPSPTVFIHYLKGRLIAQEENVFLSLDELSFLGWYLERGNFYVPLVEGGKTPKLVQLNGFCMPFDNHYLFGKKAPELKIEPDFIKIIRILEDLHQFGFSDIASSLLDFNHQDRKFILKYINELIEKTKKDQKKHDFSTISDELDMGFTFMTQYERNGLRERLGTYCTLKKYKTKIKKWIGIGRCISDNEWFVNEFIYLDFPWKMDREIEKLLEDYPFIKKFT